MKPSKLGSRIKAFLTELRENSLELLMRMTRHKGSFDYAYAFAKREHALRSG